MKIKCLIVMCVCVFYGLAHGDPAGAQLLIEDAKIKKTVAQGETYSGVLRVHNTTEKPLDVRAYWSDFEYVKPYFHGEKRFFPAGTRSRSMSDWVTFSPSVYRLAPFGMQEIRYSIKVPENAKGGYYGILFNELGASRPSERLGVSIITRIGALFIVETPDKDKSFRLDDWEISGKGLSARFINEGDVVQMPDVTYYWLNEEEMIVDRGQLDKFYLPMGREIEMAVPLPSDLNPGRYTCVITFDLDDGDSAVREVDIEKKDDGTFGIRAVRE